MTILLHNHQLQVHSIIPPYMIRKLLESHQEEAAFFKSFAENFVLDEQIREGGRPLAS